jgi:hypothetical protein
MHGGDIMKASDGKNLLFIGDVGATNVRFAVSQDRQINRLAESRLKCNITFRSIVA